MRAAAAEQSEKRAGGASEKEKTVVLRTADWICGIARRAALSRHPTGAEKDTAACSVKLWNDERGGDSESLIKFPAR